MLSLNHPGVIKLHQCFQDPKKLYFLMELAPYGELFSYMKNEGILEFAHAQFFAAEIINMIEYLHENKICHRDIKPSNLLFASDMHLKLVDFGSGKIFKNSDQTTEANVGDNQSGGSDENKKMIKRKNTFVGTCEYMSPEIILGKWVKNECDLWSLGIIIYKMFSECTPFIGEFDEDTIQKIEEESVIFPPGFPALAQDLCTKLLAKDPADRLGWGDPATESDMFSLKTHPFFDGIDFENLHNWDSPAPIPSIHRASIKTRIINKYKRSAETPSKMSCSVVTVSADFTTSSQSSKRIISKNGDEKSSLKY
jgi:3-phosphoinositide dependent protein kinase-1